MALAITDDHRQLADVVRSFVTTHDLRGSTRDTLEGGTGTGTEPPGPWKQIGDLGWTGLHLPEEFGGSGYGLPELSVVVEQFGTVAAPGAFLATVAASAVLDAVGDAELRAELLPGLADGSVLGALGLVGAVERGGAGTLAGTTGPVPGARWAGHVLIRSGADDLVLVATADPSVTLEPGPGLDPALGSARVRCDGTEGRFLPGAAAVGVRIGRALAAAEAAGGAQASLATALEYAKVRQQFGRIIGGFQAIKHHLANMLVDAERATASAWDAARAGTGEQAELASAVAAAVALDGYQRNAQQAIQILGGIGFTWEHDAHLYLRRAVSLAALWGPVDRSRDEVAALARRGVRRRYAIDLPPEADGFRAQAREFAATFLATPVPDRQRVAAESGYLVPHWPVPWGRAAGPVEQLVIEEELGGLGVPSLGIGGWVLLTLVQQGSPEQVERWTAPSLRGDLVWCQLFSEPAAGSDAAAVQTKAVQVDGGWRVTGQKVWTSNARSCNRGLATVRTDPAAAKHKGITTVVVDLHADGVEVRPLREITGDSVFNEIFFDDVFIPDEDVVGEVNAGWTVARATLGNERVSIGGSAGGYGAADIDQLLERYAPADVGLRREVGALLADEQTTRLLNLRHVARAVVGGGPGPEGNLTKLLIAEHAQRVTELGLRVAGAAAVDGSEPALASTYLWARALTIAGGTSEITRNVIAERLLGLPRDPLNR